MFLSQIPLPIRSTAWNKVVCNASVRFLQVSRYKLTPDMEYIKPPRVFELDLVPLPERTKGRLSRNLATSLNRFGSLPTDICPDVSPENEGVYSSLLTATHLNTFEDSLAHRLASLNTGDDSSRGSLTPTVVNSLQISPVPSRSSSPFYLFPPPSTPSLPPLPPTPGSHINLVTPSNFPPPAQTNFRLKQPVHQIVVDFVLSEEHNPLPFEREEKRSWTETQRELVEKCIIPKDIDDFKEIVRLSFYRCLFLY